MGGLRCSKNDQTRNPDMRSCPRFSGGTELFHVPRGCDQHTPVSPGTVRDTAQVRRPADLCISGYILYGVQHSSNIKGLECS